MKNRFSLLFVIAILSLVVIGCDQKNKPDNKLTIIGVSPRSLSLGSDASENSVKLYSNKDWSVEITSADNSAVDWVKVDKMTGAATKDSTAVTISVTKNEGKDRKATVKFKAGSLSTYVELSQRGTDYGDNITIAAVREAFKGSDMTISEDWKIRATVISDYRKSEIGGLNNATSAKSVVVSDGKAGISLRLVEDNTTLLLGDEVIISLKGAKLQLYSKLLQVNELPNANIEVTGNNPLEPTPITAAELVSGKFESMYVAVADVQTSQSSPKSFVSGDSHTSINFVAKTGEEFVIFSSKYSSFGSDKVPTGSGTLKGIVVVFNNAIQISLSSKSDCDGLTGARFNSQGGEIGQATELKSDAVKAWMELPTVSTTDKIVYISHDITFNNKYMRNYSMLYDSENKVSLWVAYPLCDVYLGSQGRSDAWEYDPKIPKDKQVDLYKSYQESGVYGRGHQIPSADRTATESLNASTYYFSNMTPQNHDLNGKVWAKTEMLIRNNVKSCDTIYVVTGAVLKTASDPTIKYAHDKSGAETAIPKGYFKVLVKYDVQTNTYFAPISFWFDHKPDTDREPNTSDTHSIEWMEQKTGYTFFTNMPASVKNKLKTQCDNASWGVK